GGVSYASPGRKQHYGRGPAPGRRRARNRLIVRANAWFPAGVSHSGIASDCYALSPEHDIRRRYLRGARDEAVRCGEGDGSDAKRTAVGKDRDSGNEQPACASWRVDFSPQWTAKQPSI